MTFLFHKGRYGVRLARTAAEMQACFALRYRCFFGGQGHDYDHHDVSCDHLMVTDCAGQVVATARLSRQTTENYTAQRYDLSDLIRLDQPMLEVGRFCIRPDVLDGDVLRAAWGALTQIVDAQGIRFLFGCTSFAGTDPAAYGRVFKRLRTNHLGPAHLRPTPKVAEAIALATIPPRGSDPMPPLLRTYLAMGGWVGEHAVIDRAMNTMHVFTCLAVDNVPPVRARSLRALAEDARLS